MLGEILNDLIPVRVLAVQLAQPVIDTSGLQGYKDRSFTEHIPRDASESPDELECYSETLLRVMDCSDLERR